MTDLVTLKSGVALPVAAVLLALDLQGRGLHLGREDGGLLVVGPCARLTAADRVLIRRWKHSLLALLKHDADAPESVQ